MAFNVADLPNSIVESYQSKISWKKQREQEAKNKIINKEIQILYE